MKKLIALSILLFATLFSTQVFAQLPPIVNCLTNVTVYITDPNAYGNGGSTVIQGNAGMTVTLDYAGCPSTDTVIGFVIFQCDTSTHCGGTEGGAGTCPQGSGFPITMPAGVYEMDMTLYSFWGCCSLTHSESNKKGCLVPIDPGTQPVAQ